MQKIINAETIAGVHTSNFRKNEINRRSKQNKPIKQ